jgi:DNA repair protein RadC
VKNAKAVKTLMGDALDGFRDIAQAYKCETLDPEVRAKLEAVYALARELTEARLQTRQALSSMQAVNEYLMVRMADLETEEFRVLFLDRKNKLIADELMGRGTVDHCPVYEREVAKRALQLNASAMILVHNHPSGDSTPSTADVEMTKRLVAALDVLGIKVHDHIVVGANTGNASLRQMGLM